MKDEKINPFVDMSDIKLEKDEVITRLNIHMKKDHVLKDGYMISNKGRVFTITKDNKLYEMKTRLSSTGYPVVHVANINGCGNPKSMISIHRAVMSSFKPCENMHELVVNHKDGNKTNDDINNLEWCTFRENSRHAIEHGLMDERQFISDKELITLMKYAYEGMTDKEISQKMNISYDMVRHARVGSSHFEGRLKYLNIEPIRLRKEPNIIVTKELVKQIMELVYNGLSDNEVAEKLNIKPITVQHVRLGNNGWDDKFKEMNLSIVKRINR